MQEYITHNTLTKEQSILITRKEDSFAIFSLFLKSRFNTEQTPQKRR